MVFALLPTIRGMKIDERPVKKPHVGVHSDYSKKGVENLLNKAFEGVWDMTNKEEYMLCEALLKDQKRVMVVSFWRPLEIVEQDPIAMCEWHSASVPTESQEADRSFYHTLHWFHSPKHYWWYLSRQTPQEATVIVHYDSKFSDKQTPHTSFTDPSVGNNLPARKSIETRIILVFTTNP